MGSGGRRVQFNSRERVLSTDQTRAEAFAARGIADVLRFMLDASAEDTRGGGNESLGLVLEAPLRATVLSGLRPRPVTGTGALLIEAGVLTAVVPDAVAGDDSVAKWVSDQGVTATGILTLTANSSGSIRIDVVECSVVDAVLEQDNRDIFNPATGLFVPVLVDKVVEKQLTYRIRTGTPGAGYPAAALGWLPLAVCSVPDGTALWDTVTLWDVRPLAQDRCNAPHLSPRNLPWQRRDNLFTDCRTNTAQRRIRGVIDADLKGYNLGGRLDLSAPGTQAGYIDITAAANQEPGVNVITPNQMCHLYLATPFGLPRWVRYADTGARVPNGHRGIPILSNTAPFFSGLPSIAIALPAATGLGGSTVDAKSVLSSFVDSVGPAVPVGIVSNYPSHSFVKNSSSLAPYIPVATTFADANNIIFNLTDNVHVPPNARAAWCFILGSASLTVVSELQFFVSGGVVVTNNLITLQAVVPYEVSDLASNITIPAGVPTPFIISGYVRVPLVDTFDWSTASRVHTVNWGWNLPIGTAFMSATVLVVGWEIGP